MAICRSCIAQAQPSKKGPDKTVKVYCAKCQEQLYKYKKVHIACAYIACKTLVTLRLDIICDVTVVYSHCAKMQIQGGKGSLVKCFVERIVEDATAGDLKCPECGTEFARPAMIRGKPANKIIGGKVTMSK